MSCTHPIRAFPTGWKTEKGADEYFVTTRAESFIPAHAVYKRFGHPSHDLTEFIEIPCQKSTCYECRKAYAYNWSLRVQAEAREWPADRIWFFTLTYNDANMPRCYRPLKKHLSDFVRALRDYQGHDKPIRFFGCGELGSRTARPHIHVVLFGLDVSLFGSRHPFDGKQFIFPVIENLWGKGFCPGEPVHDAGTVGGYVAKYQLKDFGRSGCWINSSNRPGIGSAWMEAHYKEYGAVVLGDGKGKVLRGFIPRSLRRRLKVDPNPDSARAQNAKLIAQMRACGYTVEDTHFFPSVEQYRETRAYSAAKTEAFRKILKND